MRTYIHAPFSPLFHPIYNNISHSTNDRVFHSLNIHVFASQCSPWSFCPRLFETAYTEINLRHNWKLAVSLTVYTCTCASVCTCTVCIYWDTTIILEFQLFQTWWVHLDKGRQTLHLTSWLFLFFKADIPTVHSLPSLFQSGAGHKIKEQP